MTHTFRPTRLMLLCGAAIGGVMGSEAGAQVHVQNHAAISAARMSRMHGQSAARRGGGGAMRVQGRGNAGMMNQGQGQQMVARELMTTRNLLMKADHDYNGHRARAIGHINHALASMGHRSNNAGGMGMGMNNGGGNLGAGRGNLGSNGNRNGVGNGNNANRMPQQASDVHLRQAMQRLNAIHGHMNNNMSMQSAQHGQARNHIQMAMTELNSALAIR